MELITIGVVIYDAFRFVQISMSYPTIKRKVIMINPRGNIYKTRIQTKYKAKNGRDWLDFTYDS
jgi:hypothetical protein